MEEEAGRSFGQDCQPSEDKWGYGRRLRIDEDPWNPVVEQVEPSWSLIPDEILQSPIRRTYTSPSDTVAKLNPLGGSWQFG